MRSIRLVALVLLAVSPRSLRAQSPGDDAVLDTVLRLERQAWADWQAHDLRAIRGWSAADYWSVNESGAERGIGLADIIQTFDSVALRAYRLDSMVARRVAPDVVIVAYNARIEGTYAGRDMSREVAEATVWVRRKGRWQNVFLHEITRPAPAARSN